MKKRSLAPHLSFSLTLVLLASCATTERVDEVRFVPLEEGGNEAVTSTMVDRCGDRAAREAAIAYRNQYAVSVTGVPGGDKEYDVTQSERNLVNVMENAARVDARMAANETWERVRNACMAESGFQVVTTCVSNCSQ